MSRDRKIGSAVPIQSPIKWSARNGKSFQFLKTFSPPPPLGLLHGRIVAEHRGNIDRRVKWAQTVRPKPNVQRLQQRVLRRLRFFLKVGPFAREEELCSVSYGMKNVEAIDDCDAQKRPGGDINNNSLSGREKKENKRLELLFVTNNIARRKPIENGENESKCKNRNKGGGGAIIKHKSWFYEYSRCEKRSIGGISFLPSSSLCRFKLALCKCTPHPHLPLTTLLAPSTLSGKSCPTLEHACTRAILHHIRHAKWIQTGCRVKAWPTQCRLLIPCSVCNLISTSLVITSSVSGG